MPLLVAGHHQHASLRAYRNEEDHASDRVLLGSQRASGREVRKSDCINELKVLLGTAVTRGITTSPCPDLYFLRGEVTEHPLVIQHRSERMQRADSAHGHLRTAGASRNAMPLPCLAGAATRHARAAVRRLGARVRGHRSPESGVSAGDQAPARPARRLQPPARR